MINYRYRHFASILILTFGLAACTSTGEPDYGGTQTLPPLEVPPDLTSVPTDSSFGLPAASAANPSAQQKNTPMVGSTGSVYPEFKGASIVRAGTQRWAVVQSKPETLWVSIRTFLIKLGWAIESENPKTGIMQTGWKETQPLVADKGFLSGIFSKVGSTSLKDRFRFRLEHSGRVGETELYVSHLMLEEVVVSGGGVDVVETRWQPRASDPDREAEMLNLFLRYLESGRIDKKEPDAKVSKVASRTVLGQDKDGYPVIKLDDPMNTAWRRLGIALDRTGFLVQDRDQAKRVYYVYLDAASKKSRGAFAGLFGGKKKTGRKYFQVRLVAKDRTTFVTLFDANGSKLDAADAQTMLKQLDKQLQY